MPANSRCGGGAGAREGGGPQLVVAQLLRLCGHGEHDDAHYISAQFKQSPIGRDCMKVAEEHLLRRAWADAGMIRKFREEAALEVEQAVAQVQREPAPGSLQGKLVRAGLAAFE